MIRRPPRSTLFPLHDALPIWLRPASLVIHQDVWRHDPDIRDCQRRWRAGANAVETDLRSEEHTSELQSRLHLVCRLLLEKKKKKKTMPAYCSVYYRVIIPHRV